MALKLSPLRRLPTRAPLAGVLAVVAAALLVSPHRSRAEESVPTDPRTPIHLSAADSEHLRQGMRTYLETVSEIVDALAANDVRQVAEAARKSGAKLMQDASLSAVLSLPPDFALTSAATHQKFDDLAEAASKGMSKAQALEALAQILVNCTSCHASFRIANQ